MPIMKTWNGYEIYDEYAREQINGVTTSGTGDAYIATVKDIDALTAGVSFTMIPHVISTSVSPTLNVNGLGERFIQQSLSSTTGDSVDGGVAEWITAGIPIRVTYDGTYWVVGVTRPDARYLYGAVPIENGGTGAGTAVDALHNLGIYWGLSNCCTQCYF